MAAVVWDKQKTYQLIELLESSPALWNCTLQEYRDRHVKAKYMEIIAQKLEITSAEVGRKLHNLRCQMNSELRKIKNKKSGAGADEIVKSSWEFFDSLKFMTGISECVKTVGTVPNALVSDNEETSEVVMYQAQGESSHDTSTASITADNSSKISKKRKVNKGNKPKSINEDDEELFKEAMSVLRAPSDEFDVFGNYVAVEIRQIRSEERRRRLKRIIQKAIIDMGEEEDRCEQIASTCSSGNYSDTVSDWASSSGFSNSNENQHGNLITISNLSSTPQQLASDSSDLSTFYGNYNPQ